MANNRPGFKVAPLSRDQIERITESFLRKYYPEHLQEPASLNVEHLIENTLCRKEFDFVITYVDKIDDHTEAQTIPSIKNFKIPSDCYEAMLHGQNRARFTIAHEVGHGILHAEQLKKCTVSMQRNVSELKAFESSEWQADNFAGALLVPRKTFIPYIKKLENKGISYQEMIGPLMKAYNVSYEVIIRRFRNCYEIEL